MSKENPEIKIREISAADTWGLRHRVMWPEKSIEDVKLKDDEEGTHFGLFKNGQLISVLSLFISNHQAQFRKFATENTEQGNGYGTQLLQHLMGVISHCSTLNMIWCNARVDKIAFYNKFGLTETDQKFTSGGIEYVIMQKTY